MKVSQLPPLDPQTIDGSETVPAVKDSKLWRATLAQLTSFAVAKAEGFAAAARFSAGAGEFDTPAQGLANTNVGDAFWCDNGNSTGTIYRHDAGPLAVPLQTFIMDMTSPAAAAVMGARDGSIQTAIDGKAASSHTHAISSVNGLQAVLDGKASSAHSHDYVSLNGAILNGNFRFNTGSIDINGGAGSPLQAYSENGGPAFMSFHRGQQFAMNMGLGADNIFRMGGWSAPADLLALNTTNGDLTIRGGIFVNAGYQELRGPAPTFWMRDADHRPFGMYVNDNLVHFMRGNGPNDINWTALPNGKWPMTINLETGYVDVGQTLAAESIVTRTTVYVGDDAALSDINVAHTVAVFSQQSIDRGYINFSASPGNQLGALNGQPLTFRGGGVLAHTSPGHASGNVTISSANPSGGADGDIWFKIP